MTSPNVAAWILINGVLTNLIFFTVAGEYVLTGNLVPQRDF